jgi:hypothetical protein
LLAHVIVVRYTAEFNSTASRSSLHHCSRQAWVTKFGTYMANLVPGGRKCLSTLLSNFSQLYHALSLSADFGSSINPSAQSIAKRDSSYYAQSFQFFWIFSTRLATSYLMLSPRDRVFNSQANGKETSSSEVISEVFSHSQWLQEWVGLLAVKSTRRLR